MPSVWNELFCCGMHSTPTINSCRQRKPTTRARNGVGVGRAHSTSSARAPRTADAARGARVAATACQTGVARVNNDVAARRPIGDDVTEFFVWIGWELFCWRD
jgi:hypothetical protein